MSLCDHIEKITRQTEYTLKCEHGSSASVFTCVCVSM